MNIIEVDRLEIRNYTDVLPNGLTVVTIEMPHIHTMELGMLIRAGLRFENKKYNGISHFLEHMMFRGNKAYPDSILLNREFESIGRDLRAVTHSDYTHYGFNPHISKVDRALELFAGFFTDPNFSGIDKEREIIIEEYLEDINEKGDNVDINFHACALLYKDDPLAWPTTGTPKSIKKITRAALDEYFKSYYVAENMVLAGAGPVVHEQFLEQAKKYFSDFPSGGKIISKNHFKNGISENQKKTEMVFQHDSDSQIQLQVCFRGVSYNDPDYYSAILISRVFDDGATSRLPRSLREDRGLVYSVECLVTSWSDIGTMDFDVTVSSEKVCEVLEILIGEIRRFAEQGPEEEELERVKQRYFFELEGELDSPSAQIMRYGFPRLYSNVVDNKKERGIIREISRENILAVAKRIFRPEKLNVVVVGPFTQKLKKQIEKIAAGF
ncbi:MAG: pitrilysin family protein [Nitrospinaceae bacterium]